MSLDRSKLEKVRDLGNGGYRARCPACAEGGQDRKGEHLRISPEGKFGCCVFPGDNDHRRKIFALAGDHSPKHLEVRIAPAGGSGPVKSKILGKLECLFSNPTGARSNNGSPGDLGTPGTPISNPRAYVKENTNPMYALIGSAEPVPSVPDKTFVPGSLSNTLSQLNQRPPFFTSDGTLVIPFDSPERFHWWKGGQSVALTREELRKGAATDQLNEDERIPGARNAAG
jgi:hypothetical protein